MAGAKGGRGSRAGASVETVASKSWGTTLKRMARLQPRTSWAASWMGWEKLRPIHSLMKSLGTAISRPSCLRSSRVELLNQTWKRCCPTRWAMAEAKRSSCGSCALIQLTAISLRLTSLCYSTGPHGPSVPANGGAAGLVLRIPRANQRAAATRAGTQGHRSVVAAEASCLRPFILEIASMREVEKRKRRVVLPLSAPIRFVQFSWSALPIPEHMNWGENNGDKLR